MIIFYSQMHLGTHEIPSKNRAKREMNWAMCQPDPMQAGRDSAAAAKPSSLVASGTEGFAGKQQAPGKQIAGNRAVSKSSFLSHAQCMPNLEIPAASSYETTIEEENRWLKPFEKKKEKY